MHELRLVGGRACLDFCNTLDPRESPRPRDFLPSYGDLVAWAERAGLVAAAEARSLVAEARTRPAAAGAVFEEALVLREALFRVFSSVAARELVDAADLEILNGVLQRAGARARLTGSGPGIAWSWSGDGELERPLWLVARSAAELLTSDELERLRKCAGRLCGWLFLDASKNRSRRWCSMESCGSRAKMRRLYARRRAATARRAARP